MRTYDDDHGRFDDGDEDCATEGLHALLRSYPDAPVSDRDREHYPALYDRQQRQAQSYQRRLIKAESIIAAGCRYTNTHASDLTGWRHLLDIGVEQYQREFGYTATCDAASVLADAAVRMYRAFAHDDTNTDQGTLERAA